MKAALPPHVCAAVEAAAGPVRRAAPVGGGSVGQALRAETSGGSVFVKWAGGKAGHGFAMEAAGLARLARVASEPLVVPEPLAVQDATGSAPGWIVLPWLEPARPGRDAWRAFGHALAALHAAPADVPDPARPYGLEADNRIGSKPQRNGWAGSWPAFFGERRLLAQAETVRRHGAWDARWDAPLERLVARLPEMLPEHPHAATLHGDLWAGNALGLAGGRSAIIDPASYVGHAETDLAMAHLFGGFDAAFFAGYAEAATPEPGADARREVYQLFHLINHLTHGPGYVAAVERTLAPFR